MRIVRQHHSWSGILLLWDLLLSKLLHLILVGSSHTVLGLRAHSVIDRGGALVFAGHHEI